MFEKLKIPLKLRKFQSGLIIIEDDILLFYYYKLKFKLYLINL